MMHTRSRRSCLLMRSRVCLTARLPFPMLQVLSTPCQAVGGGTMPLER